MNPIVHGELAWLLAQPLGSRKDRLLVTLAGLAPDLDSLTLLGGPDLFGQYHHKIGHGLLAAVITAGIVARSAKQRACAVMVALLAFHLHVVCDVVGDGPDWGIFYWWPLNDAEWHWAGAWPFVSWQNMLIGALATLACLGCAWWRDRTILEVLSSHWDAELVRTLQRRFGPAGRD